MKASFLVDEGRVTIGCYFTVFYKHLDEITLWFVLGSNKLNILGAYTRISCFMNSNGGVRKELCSAPACGFSWTRPWGSLTLMYLKETFSKADLEGRK